jgi:hypothetical protein
MRASLLPASDGRWVPSDLHRSPGEGDKGARASHSVFLTRHQAPGTAHDAEAGVVGHRTWVVLGGWSERYTPVMTSAGGGCR